ncbi:hypothetical protein SNOG_01901 [Parastagonospora nodorum SN15]|uniref:Cutinase n=1 Tax=Phaeosphaeria nodorum (strain SN15 / ATCC MYA-4574 / FGSC 10173) TaxID=321614 RepID=Q0V263_PHANO|nr:hypothetical protein SNOG_01901 [Parastagonospora nodorum SN15]EAT90113.2 hypothetical protein SNOG_01901 [Parastagonospora nodorum SN15]
MSSIIRNALALSAIAAVAVAQGPAPKLDAPCADAVIFMARGNNAPYQDYRTFPFVDATCGKLRAEGKTCDFIEVVFETMMNGDFCTQIATGVRNGQAQITAFNKKCPCTHIILNGFSQGAWITGDILAGPGGCSQITTGLDRSSAPGNAIAAALLWGDVMHVANQPYNVLDGASLQKDGRSSDSLARLNTYAPILRSYCAKGDPICANGDDVSKHLSYFELYTDDASTWAVGKLNEAAPLCAAPTPTPSASSTAGRLVCRCLICRRFVCWRCFGWRRFCCRCFVCRCCVVKRCCSLQQRHSSLLPYFSCSPCSLPCPPVIRDWLHGHPDD